MKTFSCLRICLRNSTTYGFRKFYQIFSNICIASFYKHRYFTHIYRLGLIKCLQRIENSVIRLYAFKNVCRMFCYSGLVVGADARIRPRVDASIDPYKAFYT